MKPPKNFSSWMGFEPENINTPLGISPFEVQNIQAALNRGSFVRMPSNGVPVQARNKIGLSGVASAGLGIIGNIISTAMTNRSNREMQREANEQNERLWREQMEYNSPVNQMARFKQAGLNPNLAYGDNGNAGAPPEYVSSKNQAPQFDPMAIANAMLLDRQMKQVDADIAVKQAQADNINADTNLKVEEFDYKPILRGLEERSRSYQDELTQSISKLNSKQAEDIEKRLNEWLSDAPYRQAEWMNKLNQQLADLNLTKAQVNYYQDLSRKVQTEINAIVKELKMLYDTPFTLDGKDGSLAFHLSRQHLLLNQNTISNSGLQNRIMEISKSIAEKEQEIYNSCFSYRKESAEHDAYMSQTLWRYATDELGNFLEPFKGLINLNLAAFGGVNSGGAFQGSAKGKGSQKSKKGGYYQTISY